MSGVYYSGGGAENYLRRRHLYWTCAGPVHPAVTLLSVCLPDLNSYNNAFRWGRIINPPLAEPDQVTLAVACSFVRGAGTSMELLGIQRMPNKLSYSSSPAYVDQDQQLRCICWCPVYLDGWTAACSWNVADFPSCSPREFDLRH